MEIVNYLKNIFDEYDITNEIIQFDKNRAGIIAQIGNGKGPTIAFDGHEDTGAIGDVSRWQFNPLGAENTDDKIYWSWYFRYEIWISCRSYCNATFKKAGVNIKWHL